jgi:hypothetical protein
MCAGATASCRGQVRAQVSQTTGRGYQADPTATRLLLRMCGGGTVDCDVLVKSTTVPLLRPWSDQRILSHGRRPFGGPCSGQQ